MFMQIAETVRVHVFMQIAETVVGVAPRPNHIVHCSGRGALKAVPATDPPSPSHSPTLHAPSLEYVRRDLVPPSPPGAGAESLPVF